MATTHTETRGSGASEAASHATVTEVGRWLNVTRQRVRQLTAEGIVPVRPDGRYDLLAAVHAYIAWIKAPERRTARSEAEATHRQMRTREIELRIAERERQLMQTSEAISFIDELIGVFTAELAGLPARVAGRDRHLRGQVEDEVHRLRRQLAAKVEKLNPRDGGPNV